MQTQSHIQPLCPALKDSEALILAHHNLVQPLWKGIEDSTNGWIIITEQMVAGLQGLQQPKDQIYEWQRAWDEVTDLHLEEEAWNLSGSSRQRRHDN